MNKKRIEASWRSYRATYPKETSPGKIREIKIAFHAGATGLLNMLLRNLDLRMKPTGDDLRMIGAVQSELLVYAEALGTPREDKS